MPPRRRTYTSAEVAAMLGMSLNWFYRKVHHLTLIDGLPRPVTSTGRKRYDASSIDAWLARFHPLAPPPAANDSAPPIVPDRVETVRTFLQASYANDLPLRSD